MIEARISSGHAVNAAALADEFSVSEDAIRRDLRALAKDGRCKRVYGGALPMSPASSPVQRRQGEDVTRKRVLATAALDLIASDTTLFLDCGSTNLQLAAMLPGNTRLRVVTNSAWIAAELAGRSDLSLVVIGGILNPYVGGCVGARSITEMQRYTIDLCFLGACAMSSRSGLAGFDMADVDFKSALIGASSTKALMLTSSKIETTAPFKIGPANGLDHLIVEHDAPQTFVDEIRKLGVKTRVAGQLNEH